MRHIASYKQMTDSRGRFRGIVNFGKWGEINFVETIAGVVRGGHYHKETQELFLILRGRIEVTIAPIGGAESATFLARKGDIFLVEPMERHTFKCLNRSCWINVLSRALDDNRPDFHRI